MAQPLTLIFFGLFVCFCRSTVTLAKKAVKEVTQEQISPDTPSTITVNEDSDGNVIDEENEADISCPVSPRTMAVLSDQTQCLNDIVINAAQQLLRRQYLNVNGLLDTVVVAACAVEASSLDKSSVIQIVFDSVRKHWLTVSNEGCASDHLAIYCSLQLIPSNPCIETIARLFCCETKTLTLDVINTRQQQGSVDCGLFAIAYADMLARKQDPCNIIFEQSEMRNHLLHCLQVGQISQFPISMFRTPRHRCVRTATVELFCVCRSTYTVGQNMLQCAVCQEWYHQRCVDLNDDSFTHFSQPSVVYVCSTCEKLKHGMSNGKQ